jgi:hypothetical protein
VDVVREHAVNPGRSQSMAHQRYRSEVGCLADLGLRKQRAHDDQTVDRGSGNASSAASSGARFLLPLLRRMR